MPRSTSFVGSFGRHNWRLLSLRYSWRSLEGEFSSSISLNLHQQSSREERKWRWEQKHDKAKEENIKGKNLWTFFIFCRVFTSSHHVHEFLISGRAALTLFGNHLNIQIESSSSWWKRRVEFSEMNIPSFDRNATAPDPAIFHGSSSDALPGRAFACSFGSCDWKERWKGNEWNGLKDSH